MKKKYKISFILVNLEGEEESTYQRLSNYIESLNAKIEEVKKFGNIEFSRITKKTEKEGNYIQYYVIADKHFPNLLKNKLKLEQKIKRILIELY